jgi:hypothetical protein
MTSVSVSSLKLSRIAVGVCAVALVACGNSDSIGALGLGHGGGAGSAATGGASSGGVIGAGGGVGTGGAVAGTGGAGGQLGPDAAEGKPDVPLSTDASALAALCTATGGQLTTQMCCASLTEYPDTCAIGACGCGPTSSHSIPVCACPTGGCFSPSSGCTSTGSGGAIGTGGASGKGGASGTGGTVAPDAAKPDALVSPDAAGLALLCTSTGGEISSGLCCGGATDFPDSCLTGACGCAPSSSHSVATCICKTGACFNRTSGCAVSGAADAAIDMDAYNCRHESDGDSQCPTGTSNFYACTLSMLPSPCVIRSIGDVTNTFCCP